MDPVTATLIATGIKEGAGAILRSFWDVEEPRGRWEESMADLRRERVPSDLSPEAIREMVLTRAPSYAGNVREVADTAKAAAMAQMGLTTKNVRARASRLLQKRMANTVNGINAMLKFQKHQAEFKNMMLAAGATAEAGEQQAGYRREETKIAAADALDEYEKELRKRESTIGAITGIGVGAGLLAKEFGIKSTEGKAQETIDLSNILWPSVGVV